MHIDEDTHRTNEPKFIGNGMYLLRKRTVDCVVLPSLSTGPQEPRRPRFSFFQSSQCQRADPVCDFRRRRRWRRSLRISRTVVCLRLPGSRPALAVIAEQWERLALGVVSGAGCIRDVSVCQHPIFNFRQNRNSKLKVGISSFLSEACFSRWRLAAPRSSAMGGLYGRPFWVSTAENDESDIFRPNPAGPSSCRSGAYIARARETCHLVIEAIAFKGLRAALGPCGKPCCRPGSESSPPVGRTDSFRQDPVLFVTPPCICQPPGREA